MPKPFHFNNRAVDLSHQNEMFASETSVTHLKEMPVFHFNIVYWFGICRLSPRINPAGEPHSYQETFNKMFLD